MLTCQTIYGTERGAELSAFIEDATGSPCPCRQGRPCPMLPTDEATPGGVMHRAGGSAGAEQASDAEPFGPRP